MARKEMVRCRICTRPATLLLRFPAPHDPTKSGNSSPTDHPHGDICTMRCKPVQRIYVGLRVASQGRATPNPCYPIPLIKTSLFPLCSFAGYCNASRGPVSVRVTSCPPQFGRSRVTLRVAPGCSDDSPYLFGLPSNEPVHKPQKELADAASFYGRCCGPLALSSCVRSVNRVVASSLY